MEFTNRDLTQWTAADWTELCSVWDELVGIPGDEEKNPGLHFRGSRVDRSQAGYVFQTWIGNALRLSPGGIEWEGPIRVPTTAGPLKEEIDGVGFVGWQSFIVESKFGESVDFGPIGRLHLLAERRPAGTMGLLFSAQGFSGSAIESAQELRPIRVLLFELADLKKARDDRDLVGVVRIKWKQAVKLGRPNAAV